jgi:hypothetical protein
MAGLFYSRGRSRLELVYGPSPNKITQDRRRSGTLAAFEHQGTFTADKDSAHLGRKAFHQVQDGFSLTAPSEVNPRARA